MGDDEPEDEVLVTLERAGGALLGALAVAVVLVAWLRRRFHA